MRIILLLLLIISPHVMANNETIKVAVNIGPPWAYFDEDKGIVGIDVDIIKHIFNNLGYNTEFHLMGYSRLIKEFKEGKFDVASPAAFSAENAFLTDTYLPFKDVAVTLASKNLKIETLQDLKGKRIIAYQFATGVLGDAFANTVKNESYLEIAEREVQVKLLVNERADVVIGERRLLTYIMNKLYPGEALTIHPIFVEQPYGAITNNPALTEAFDTELQKLKASGEYQTILNQWP